MNFKPTGRDLELIAPTICIGRGFGKIKLAGSGAFQTPITSGVPGGPSLDHCREHAESLGDPNTSSFVEAKPAMARINEEFGRQKMRCGEFGVLGFEPRLADSESAVLPLHHTPAATRFPISDNASCASEQRLQQIAGTEPHQLPSQSRSNMQVLSENVTRWQADIAGPREQQDPSSV